MKLEEPSPFDYVQLNSEASVPRNGDELTTMGFGWMSEGGEEGRSDVLREVDVNYIERCNVPPYVYQHRGFDYNSQYHVCAGVPEGGKDSCRGMYEKVG